MQREIVTDVQQLAVPSTAADPTSEADRQIALDLKETLEAHRDACVGMAANMIGEHKHIIVFVDDELGGRITTLFNPQISAADGAFDTSEGCLSLEGERRTVRYDRIEVDYESRTGKPRHATFHGWPAQIIQHEIDHCNGIII